MYFAFPTTPAEEERCRRLLVAYRSELESIPFTQAKIGAKGKYTPLFDGDDLLRVVYDGDYMLMPGLDRGGWKSVLVGKIRQGPTACGQPPASRPCVSEPALKLPALPYEQFLALRDNIAVNGVLVPILVDGHGPRRKIIDGNYRKAIAHGRRAVSG
jgi:hypothetical protein